MAVFAGVTSQVTKLPSRLHQATGALAACQPCDLSCSKEGPRRGCTGGAPSMSEVMWPSSARAPPCTLSETYDKAVGLHKRHFICRSAKLYVHQPHRGRRKNMQIRVSAMQGGLWFWQERSSSRCKWDLSGMNEVSVNANMHFASVSQASSVSMTPHRPYGLASSALCDQIVRRSMILLAIHVGRVGVSAEDNVVNSLVKRRRKRRSRWSHRLSTPHVLHIGPSSCTEDNPVCKDDDDYIEEEEEGHDELCAEEGRSESLPVSMSGWPSLVEGKMRSVKGLQLQASAFRATAREAERRARRSAERVRALRENMTSRSKSHLQAGGAIHHRSQDSDPYSSSSPQFSTSVDQHWPGQVNSKPPKRGGGTSSWIAMVGNHPPLSREEEHSLSRDVRDLQALLSKKEQLTESLGREPSDLEWAESEDVSLCRLLARIGKGRAAKRRMVEANLKLVDSIADGFRGRGLSHSELCQEGVKGLLRSAEKYDSSKNVKFSTYSFEWIRQKIGNALRMYGKPVKIGRTAWDKMWMLLRRRQALISTKGGQQISLEEAATGSGVSVSVVRALRLALMKSVPLDVPFAAVPSQAPENSSDLTLEQTLPSTPAVDTCPLKAVDEFLMNRELNEAVSQLVPCQQAIIRLLFGLGGEEPRLKKVVSEELGISPETLRKQERLGLQQIRENWGSQLEAYFSESSSSC